MESHRTLISPQDTLVRGVLRQISAENLLRRRRRNLLSLAVPRRSIMPRLGDLADARCARPCGAREPGRAGFRTWSSDILPRSFLVIENRIDDLGADHLVPRAGSESVSPMRARPFSISAMAIERSSVGEMIGRCDLADRFHRRLVFDFASPHRRHPAALRCGSSVRRPDELLAARSLEIGLLQRALAEEIRLLLGHQAVKPDIDRASSVPSVSSPTTI